MADQARNTLSLADFIPEAGSQSSGQPNEPTRQANNAEMAPQGAKETHQVPPPTGKDLRSTPVLASLPLQPRPMAPNKNKKNMHTKPNINNQNQKKNPPNIQLQVEDKNGTDQQSQDPPQGEQAQANATPNNPWMSGQSLADRLSNKKTRTMRLWLPNAADTQRLIAMSLESMVDTEKRIEHFEFIKRVNKDLGWNMDYDTPLIIPLPHDLKATRIAVAECINTEQTDSVVLEMIRQKRISKVHFQQHRHQVVLWLQDKYTRSQLCDRPFNIMGVECFPRSKIPLADHHYMDIIGLGHSFDYMELFTKLLTKQFRPVHITPKEMDKDSNMSSGHNRVYFAEETISSGLVKNHQPIQQIIFNRAKYPVRCKHDNHPRIGTFRDASPQPEPQSGSQSPKTTEEDATSSNSSQSVNKSTPREKLTDDISNAGSEYTLIGRKRRTNRDLTIAAEETNPLQDWHSPNLFEIDYIIQRCPMTTIKYKKIHFERVDAKITKRLKKKSQQGKPPRVGVAVDDWNISDIAQTMVKTTEHMNPTGNLAAAHKAKASYLKLAAKFTTLVDWEKCLELIRQEPLGSYLALDHIRRVDPSEYKNILERHLHQLLQSATFHTDTMSGTQAFQTIFKDKPTTRDGIMTAFNTLLQQIQPTELQMELMWAQWDLILQCLVPQLYNCDAWVLYYTKHTVNWLPTQHMRLLSNDSLHRLLLSPLGDKLLGWLQSQKWEDDSVETLVNFKSQSPRTFAMSLQIISEADKLLLRYQHLQYPLLS
ncbi:hypothetical protein AC1031_014539 [Aphanomyces cochlioides]|nr:hypothetical protein AC1031_014539 [Aphanomyces cochlioides]